MLTFGKPASQAAFDFGYESPVNIPNWPPQYAEAEHFRIHRNVNGLVHGPVCPYTGALTDERKSSHQMVQVGKRFCGEAHITLCKGFMPSAR